MEADFRHLFSARNGCDPNDFEQMMFSKSLFRHAVLIAPFLRNKTKFFREDREMLRDIASARNTQEVISELNRFYGRNRRDRSILRTSFFVRISGKRVLRIYRTLLSTGQEITRPSTLQPLR